MNTKKCPDCRMRGIAQNPITGRWHCDYCDADFSEDEMEEIAGESWGE